jgi:glucose/arabinose dehydrogenase
MQLNKFFTAAALAAASLPAFAAPPADLSLVRVPDASTTFSSAVAVRAPHDGSNRLFVVQRNGTIRVIKNGTLLATPFLTVSTSVGSESGLLGLAFHPNFGKASLPHNTEFYIFYTRPGADPQLGSYEDEAVARYTVPTPTSDVANSAGTIIMRLPDLADNHNGGDIHFGADGYLYISSGDSGAQGNPHGFAECLWKKPADNDKNSCGTNPNGTQYFLLGKMLRVDVDTRGGTVTPDMCGSSGITPAEYSIPAGNPHVGTSNTCDEIWSRGYRNPWRFSFDRADNRLIIGDVGQGSWEEITVDSPAGGADHGWSRCEGRHYDDVSGSGTTCPGTTGTVAPVIEYSHSGRCAVAGGYVFRGPIASMRGTYFYGDSCNSSLWWSESTGATWDSGGEHSIAIGTGTIYGFGEDEPGNLYIVRSNGQIQRLSSDSIFEDDFDL